MKSVRLILALAFLAVLGRAEASSTISCNGDLYTWPDQFQNYNYVTNWPLLVNDCIADMASKVTAASASATSAANSATTATTSAATQGTSTTSLTIGTGTQSPTIQTGKGFLPGMQVRIADQGAPTANFMDGVVSSYNSGTGALVVSVTNVGGSGTKTAWNVFMEGPFSPLPTIATGHLLGNASGGPAQAGDTSLSALLDNALGSTIGGAAVRGSSGWTILTGAAGTYFQFQGAGTPAQAVQSPVLYTQYAQTVVSTGVSSVDFTGFSATDAVIDMSGFGQSTGSSTTFQLYYSTNGGTSWTSAGTITGTMTSSVTYSGDVAITGLRVGYALASVVTTTTTTPFAVNMRPGAQINGLRLIGSTGNIIAGTFTLEIR